MSYIKLPLKEVNILVYTKWHLLNYTKGMEVKNVLLGESREQTIQNNTKELWTLRVYVSKRWAK